MTTSPAVPFFIAAIVLLIGVALLANFGGVARVLSKRDLAAYERTGLLRHLVPGRASRTEAVYRWVGSLLVLGALLLASAEALNVAPKIGGPGNAILIGLGAALVLDVLGGAFVAERIWGRSTKVDRERGRS